MVGNSRETTDSIAWYSSLVGGDPLPYDILFRLVLFLFTCLEQEREADAAAVFTMLRDHANALDALPYDVAALLAAPALLVLNSHVTILFGLGQSLLRALLERQLKMETRELLSSKGVAAHEAAGGGYLAGPTWKASLLHTALRQGKSMEERGRANEEVA